MTRPLVVETIQAMRAALAEHVAAGRTVALVPTLGALHDGHLAHVARARQLADVVVVSIFVNPLQFGANEDLEKYPRDLEGDLDQLAVHDIDYVFAPSVAQMFPDGDTQVKVTGGPVSTMFEGRARPGHFDGVLTVVAKFLHIVQPQVVTFGQKDAQQLFLVQRMVKDLDIPVKIEVIETVREADELALSSRNRFLSHAERRAARAIPRAIEAAASASDLGIDTVIAASQAVLMDEQLVSLDYLKVVDPRTFLPVDDGYRGPARVIIAAKVGTTRLIDNDSIYLN
ncbi:MAG: pantoate--beta-alanine ligase [Pseudolysinimonas sp.]